MGQIEQESRCREKATAFDGGQGLGQFMPATAKWIQTREPALREISAYAAPYNPAWAIRALVLYDAWLYRQTDCEGWYFAFRAYNGGQGLLNKEIRRAGSCEKRKVEKSCIRKTLSLSSGRKLNLCDVNIEYPALIERTAVKYAVPGVGKNKGK